MNKEQTLGEKLAWAAALLSGLGMFFILSGDSVSRSYIDWVIGIFLTSVVTICYYENAK